MDELERDPIPEEFPSLEAAGEFWDTHSAADYWDLMEDVEFKVDIQRRRFAVYLDSSVYQIVEQVAATRKVPPDDLVNQLLRQELLSLAV